MNVDERRSSMEERDPRHRFTVIYPALDVRGGAAERLRAWISEQTLAKSRYRVIAVLQPGRDDESAIRAELTADDVVIYETVAADTAMWNAGATRAKTPWLVFVEGHSPARRDCLEALDRWLDGEPAAAAGNFTIGHRDDYMMAQLSDRWFGEQQSRWRDEWPRLHRAGFAIRRDVFESLGGFPHYGQFGPPLLSAQLDAAGHPVVAVPGAEVVHIDDHTVHDHHFDTLDYVRGECAARSACEPSFFEHYFGHNDAWNNQLAREPGAARQAIRAALRAAVAARKADIRILREVWRMVPLASFATSTRLRFAAVVTKLDEVLVQHAPMSTERRYSWFVNAHRRVVEDCARRWVHEARRDSPGATVGRWPIEQLGPWIIGGLHGLEMRDERAFRWSEPLMKIKLSNERLVREVRIETGALRADPAAAVLLACCGPHPLPRDCIRAEPYHAGVIIEIPGALAAAAAQHGVSVLVDPVAPSPDAPSDARRLGLPIFAVEIRA